MSTGGVSMTLLTLQLRKQKKFAWPAASRAIFSAIIRSAVPVLRDVSIAPSRTDISEKHTAFHVILASHENHKNLEKCTVLTIYSRRSQGI